MSDLKRWVCDGCMHTVTRRQIWDFADGEHVLCKACHAHVLHDTVAHVRGGGFGRLVRGCPACKALAE
jgi:hypothetical protein